MTDDLLRPRWKRQPTPAQPLIGVTILAVEDSRFASEALRLLALRSGARLRRADCIASARRHLSVYRPSVVLIDIGLPDGRGTELIAELMNSDVTPPVVIAMSGDDAAEAEARDAGAHGFLSKPLEGVSLFQSVILANLPPEAQPSGPRLVGSDAVRPDTFALKDDLSHAARVLEEDGEGRRLDYAAQFVGSLARSSRDAELAEAAQLFARSRAGGGAMEDARMRLSQVVQDRLAIVRPI